MGESSRASEPSLVKLGENIAVAREVPGMIHGALLSEGTMRQIYALR